MAEVKAYLRRLRISPRKVALVVGLVRGLPLKQAKIRLQFLNKRAGFPILKLLNSAESNAKHNFKIADTDSLYIKEIKVDEGPTLKRHMPRARGRATVIRKRTSQVSLVLSKK